MGRHSRRGQRGSRGGGGWFGQSLHRRHLHRRRKCDCQSHRQMEREQLVGAGFGDEIGDVCLRWRCRAATCMRGAISRRRAAARPITSPNGTGAVGRRWVRGWVAPMAMSSVNALAVSGSDRVCGGLFHDGGRQSRPITSPNGTGAVGRRWVRGWTAISVCVCTGGVGQQPVCGGRFHDGGRQRGQLHRQMGREQLVGAGFGDGGPNAHVYALAVSGSDVYAGGDFTTAGGSAANNIAKWDGSSWSALGSGMNGDSVYALAVSGSDLYAGGDFTTAGGSAANYIAKWNGSSWSALGSGMGGQSLCDALAVSGSDLYAGGDFTTAGGSAANYIAKWDGSSWSALGSGMNSSCVCAGGVGQRPVCGGRVHDGGRQRGQLHRQMEREQLVGAGFGDEQHVCMRWRCRAATCMREASSRRRAAARPITSPNGTGAVGRRWVRG